MRADMKAPKSSAGARGKLSPSPTTNQGSGCTLQRRLGNDFRAIGGHQIKRSKCLSFLAKLKNAFHFKLSSKGLSFRAQEQCLPLRAQQQTFGTGVKACHSERSKNGARQRAILAKSRNLLLLGNHSTISLNQAGTFYPLCRSACHRLLRFHQIRRNNQLTILESINRLRSTCPASRQHSPQARATPSPDWDSNAEPHQNFDQCPCSIVPQFL